MQKGLIHIYCGDGKGKTTAAAGLAVRCAGGGGKVLFYQFLKDGTSGEIAALRSLENITVPESIQGIKFSFKMTDEEKRRTALYCQNAFDRITELAEKYDLLVLDEVLHAINLGYIGIDRAAEFLKNKPKSLEVVMTGTNPPTELCNLADYISEIKKIKHPYDRGIAARRLIEM